MRKILLATVVALTMATGAFASEDKPAAQTVAPAQDTPAEASFSKQGFLTTKWCAEQGLFKDCRLESIVCGEGECYQKWEFGDPVKTELVIYVHDELQYYNISPAKGLNVPAMIEKGINQNLVTIEGTYDSKTNTIAASGFKAPPPPAKSFFKGCL
jgi:hypothetical protein